MSALRSRLRRFDLAWLDWIVAGALIVDMVLEAALADGVPRSDRIATAIFAGPFGATVAVRRRWPAAAVVAASLVALAQEPFHGRLFDLPSQSASFVPMLLSYGAAAWLSFRRNLAAVGIAAALLFGDTLIETYVTHVSDAGGVAGGVGLLAFFYLGPFVIGLFARERQRRAEAFTRLAAHAEAERSERERAAIAAERLTIGRELQDIIAHSVSVMVVQAGGARRLLRAEPDRARDSILAVEQTGREALAEMRRLLGLLRKNDDPRALAPQPGLDQLPELLESLRAGGLSCELGSDSDSDDHAPALTPGINLVAFRVIEAGLRSLGPGGGRRATITVGYGARWLELGVRADGPVSTEVDEELQTVAERVALYGGQLSIPGAGAAEFELHCRLPLETMAAA
jgi:signal transduction histidine kinase